MKEEEFTSRDSNIHSFTKKLVVIFIFLFFLFVFLLNYTTRGSQHFTYLAESFLSGKFWFLEKPFSWNDTAYLNGKYHWPLGPFPAVLLIPFVYIFKLMKLPFSFSQGYLQTYFVYFVFLIVYEVAKKFRYSVLDSLFLAFAFTFGSVFFQVASIAWSYWFSQVVVVLFLWLLIWEFLNKKRYLLIGLYLACVLATRVTAFLAVLLLLLDVLFSRRALREKAILIFRLSLFPVIVLILLFYYNHVRFGNILETGYSMQLVTTETLRKAKSYGLLSFTHLPGNLYYFLLSPPLPVFKDGISPVLRFPYLKPNSWGMSVFITSPYLFYMFVLSYKDRLSKYLWITTLSIAIPIFLYYGIGIVQYGYRYALDFFPFIFLLFMRGYRLKYTSLSSLLRYVFILSGLLNLFFLLELMKLII